MENKIIRTTFYMGEFPEEEKWLELQHREGWKLVKTDGRHYEFEKCEPQEWIYQLDFKKNGIAEAAYIQMFADYGWEFVQPSGKWFIFRKRKLEGDLDLSIFSDKESRIEMCSRVNRGRLWELLPLLFMVGFWNYLLFFTDLFSGNGPLRNILSGAGTAALLILVAGSLSRFRDQQRKINQIIAGLKNPLG
jgi:hypothetical protein